MKLVSGSTSPTTRRLEYPYSYDSASKFNPIQYILVPIQKETFLKINLFLFFQSWSADGERRAWSIECFINTIIGVQSVFDSTALHVTSAAFVSTIEKHLAISAFPNWIQLNESLDIFTKEKQPDLSQKQIMSI